ncbi:MAG TPA: quinone-dependent dihydroorotate dehydrogenase [Methylophilaceae bacterium]|nr:quinone-dependent dihydroorotate dehydrogenase [Methylophilaceae bacterium]
MDIYSLSKPFLFKLDPERSHDLTLKSLQWVGQIPVRRLFPAPPQCQPRQVMGLTFPNPVGLAAGLDKNGAYIDGLAALGFGFIEVGTVTPRPQPGNPKPRLFRIPVAEGIINRFGFNNLGVDNLVENVKRSQYKGVLGINIGKNFDTPNERAIDDYLIGLRKVYLYASYVVVNISSPNTKNLRQLQEREALAGLLSALKSDQAQLAQAHGRYVPIALKIAPDLESEQVGEIASLLLEYQMDAVIATNTTLAREAVAGLPHAEEAGGLSGAPVKNKSTLVIRQLAQHLGNEIPIIGVGGIMSGEDAREKIEAGANLVQVYSGLIYRGPRLVSDICKTIG